MSRRLDAFFGTFLSVFLGCSGGLPFLSSFSLAMGRAPSTQPASEPPASPAPIAFSSADPVREVWVRPVGKTQAFPLTPGGSQPVNLQPDLGTIFWTELVRVSRLKPVLSFTPVARPPLPDCSQHLEIEADLTAFTLDSADMSVHIGYSSGGALNPGSLGAQGDVTFQVGSARMDFHLFLCNMSQCEELLASSADQGVKGGNALIKLNAGLFSPGWSLVWNTPLSAVFTKIMDQGIASLVSDANYENLVPWKSRVYQVDPVRNLIYFEGGSSQLIGPSQAFTVLAPVATDECPVYQSVANIHTTHVEENSTAVIDSWFDGKKARGIKEGDAVILQGIQKIHGIQ